MSGFLTESSSLQSYIPPALLAHAGYSLEGKMIDSEGEFSGPVVTSANVLEGLEQAVAVNGTFDPNPYGYAYSYPGFEESEEGFFGGGEGDPHYMQEFQTAWNLADKLFPWTEERGVPAYFLSDADLAAALPSFTEIEADLVQDDDIEEAILEFGQSARAEHDEEISRLKAAAFANDTHLTSAFYITLGNMLSARARDVNTIRGRLYVDRSGRQAALNLEAAKANLQRETTQYQLGLEARRLSLTARAQEWELNKIVHFAHFEAARARYDHDIALNHHAVTWKFEQAMRYGQLTIPYAGMPLQEPQPSRLEKGISAALAVGPSVGLMVGDAAGPQAGVAAGVGAMALAFGSQMLR